MYKQSCELKGEVSSKIVKNIKSTYKVSVASITNYFNFLKSAKAKANSVDSLSAEYLNVTFMCIYHSCCLMYHENLPAEFIKL